MVNAFKPAGYVVTYTPEGKKVEQELRQCSHCQYSWIYKPGSGIKRRICLKCMGLCCGRPECNAGCAPFQEITLNRDKNYELTSAGVYVKKG